MLHRVLLTAASVVALSAAANAADMYRAPASAGMPYVGVNWSGLYFGANLGAAWHEDTSDNVGIAGGQIGYNIQRGNLVLGLESDIAGSDEAFDYLGTVRGRVGYAFDRALVYATGGYAYAGAADAEPSTVDGWVVGGGLEYKLAPAWSVKGEYQHAEFTSLTPSASIETFRLGVNYFVGGGYDPLK